MKKVEKQRVFKESFKKPDVQSLKEGKNPKTMSKEELEAEYKRLKAEMATVREKNPTSNYLRDLQARLDKVAKYHARYGRFESLEEDVDKSAREKAVMMKFYKALEGLRNAFSKFSDVWESDYPGSGDNLSYELCNDLFSKLNLFNLFPKSIDEYPLAIETALETLEPHLDESLKEDKNWKVHKIGKFKINGESFDEIVADNISEKEAHDLVLKLRDEEKDDRFTYVSSLDESLKEGADEFLSHYDAEAGNFGFTSDDYNKFQDKIQSWLKDHPEYGVIKGLSKDYAGNDYLRSSSDGVIYWLTSWGFDELGKNEKVLIVPKKSNESLKEAKEEIDAQAEGHKEYGNSDVNTLFGILNLTSQSFHKIWNEEEAVEKLKDFKKKYHISDDIVKAVVKEWIKMKSTKESLKEEEPKLETFDEQMDFLAKDEQEAIDGYNKVLALVEEDHVREQLQHILDEEEAHKAFLEAVKDDHSLVYSHEDKEEEKPEEVIDDVEEIKDVDWDELEIDDEVVEEDIDDDFGFNHIIDEDVHEDVQLCWSDLEDDVEGKEVLVDSACDTCKEGVDDHKTGHVKSKKLITLKARE